MRVAVSLSFSILHFPLSILPASSREDPHTADAPLPAIEAAATMAVPQGFRVTLFAAEPEVVQPIGFCIDDRGRLWVAEAHNYPVHGERPGDRIVILEDTDLDGRADKRTVFFDGLNYVTGIEVGFGGAWVMSPPYFYFIPDRDGDDVPDAEPEVVLDGFGNHANAHNLANGFAWGPDGWLYGTHGRTNWSLPARPGTPEEERAPFDGGVYRFHPVTREWEPFADGTTNPWGIDWNDHGEAFVSNCVDPHLFHVIQGAHYEPWRSRESSRYAYERIDTIADHLHYVGTSHTAGLGTDEVNAAGGGHAHCGMMVYLGDTWPEAYRNSVFINNIHGRRINNDIPRRHGSGYTASHGADFMIAKDPWYMGVTLACGPGGAVYASDWSDTGECHSTKNTRRETGRIYRITFGEKAPPAVDLAAASDRELLDFQGHRDDWFVRHARRRLQERAAAGADLAQFRDGLAAMFDAAKTSPQRLRALWALHVTGGLDEAFLLQQLRHEDEHVRAWAVRLLREDDAREPSPAVLEKFFQLAAEGDSALVRLQVACALQRLPPENRWTIASALARRAENADDPNLPLLTWYGIEPLLESDLRRFVSLASTANIPLVRRFVARRAVSVPDPLPALELLCFPLRSGDTAVHRDILTGILEGLAGRRSLPLPGAWSAAYVRLQQSGDDAVLDAATRLAVVFDDPEALAALKKQADDPDIDPKARVRAVEALVARRPDDLAPLLLLLLESPVTARAALRGLPEYDHPETATAVLDHYPDFDAATRRDAIQALASRPAWAHALLDALETQFIPRTDLDAFTARQLDNLGDPGLGKRIAALWGEVRSTPADKKKLIEDYRAEITPDVVDAADPGAGRILFQNTCAACHKFFGEGGELGPELTGSQRANLDYLLENIVDPSAAVSRDYQMEVIETQNGRILTGFLITEDASTLTLRTINEKLTLPLAEIKTRETSRHSIMPEGLLTLFTPMQRADLVAYLSSPSQVPLPAGN